MVKVRKIVSTSSKEVQQSCRSTNFIAMVYTAEIEFVSGTYQHLIKSHLSFSLSLVSKTLKFQ